MLHSNELARAHIIYRQKYCTTYYAEGALFVSCSLYTNIHQRRVQLTELSTCSRIGDALDIDHISLGFDVGDCANGQGMHMTIDMLSYTDDLPLTLLFTIKPYSFHVVSIAPTVKGQISTLSIITLWKVLPTNYEPGWVRKQTTFIEISDVLREMSLYATLFSIPVHGLNSWKSCHPNYKWLWFCISAFVILDKFNMSLCSYCYNMHDTDRL